MPNDRKQRDYENGGFEIGSITLVKTETLLHRRAVLPHQ